MQRSVKHFCQEASLVPAFDFNLSHCQTTCPKHHQTHPEIDNFFDHFKQQSVNNKS